MSTHYSCALQAKELSVFADLTAAFLIKLLDEDEVDIEDITLVYRGMSGIALATAVSLSLYRCTGVEVGMVYVRKEEEVSHGSAIERSYKSLRKGQVFVFVDDFIAGGGTIHEVIRVLSQYREDFRPSYTILWKAILYPLSWEEEIEKKYVVSRIPHDMSLGDVVELHSTDKNLYWELGDYVENRTLEPFSELNYEGLSYFLNDG